MSTDTPWFKSTRSGSNGGQCVEVRRHDGAIQVRDSKAEGTGPVLTFSRDEWEAFIEGARRGEFDLS
ncbi:DUF397 domain-containing protein [Planosporangium thailandense]|uniref:DUF397 domain-containing protein n=1 Tax=Planosporangium thailandense TaxID=765197 RepID=A0ABX0XUQ3_9ACTN|nr:DUF397 domain-containing protein [Planosporangium thailandense]NJC69748.1 DUF397 domain-containing protein [Planosporangium thailandense]